MEEIWSAGLASLSRKCAEERRQPVKSGFEMVDCGGNQRWPDDDIWI
jgi:hypothetical protein